MLTVVLLVLAQAEPGKVATLLPENVAIAIQVEKLRMNVFEVREITLSERRVRASLGVIGGAGLLLNAILNRGSTTEAITLRVVEGVTGSVLFAATLPLMFLKPDEYDLWDDLEALRIVTSSSPEVFLAQAESLFEARVEKATSSRRLASDSKGATNQATPLWPSA